MKPDSGPEENSNKSEAITNRPDDWLLREWKAGNERAAEVFANRYAIRLVALVANRLNRRYRSSVDPEEVVQSALGSFFNAARHSRIEVSGSVSLWRLLATFVRRKMARSIERQSPYIPEGSSTDDDSDEGDDSTTASSSDDLGPRPDWWP